MRLCRAFLGRIEQVWASQPDVTSRKRRLVDVYGMMENRSLTFCQPILERTQLPYRRHLRSRSACQLSQGSRTHRFPLRD